MRQKDAKSATADNLPMRGNHPMYRENPSIVGRFPVSLRSKTKSGNHMMVSPGTGEIIGENAFSFVTEEEVDNEQFIKIYLAGVKGHGELTKAGLTIFEFVYMQMSGIAGKDKDTIALNHYIAQDWKPDLTRPTFYRGLNELLDKGFLFRTLAADMYFINVRFMFNGDRMHVIKSYQLKKSSKRVAVKSAHPELFFGDEPPVDNE